MGSKSKGRSQVMNFSDAVRNLKITIDERVDTKILEVSKQFTNPIASIRTRTEVLEDIIKEKFGETDESLGERVVDRIEKNQGFIEVKAPAKLTSIVRVRIKEEDVGKESPATLMQDAFMVVGEKQIHEEVDKLLLGMNAGETKDVVVADLQDATKSVRITVFLARVFKGREEASNEKAPEAIETTTTQSEAPKSE